MPEPNPLDYFTSDSLMEALQDRNDTAVILLFKRDREDATSLVSSIGGEYVVALGLMSMLPEMIEEALGESVRNLDEDDGDD